jgi:hypothetical protein
MFGVRGNRANIAVTGWFVDICYVRLNWAAVSLAAFGLPSSSAPGRPQL